MTFFAVIAFAVAAGFLVRGIASMAQGGAFDEAHAVQYMTGRVVMQGVAVLCILLAMLSAFL